MSKSVDSVNKIYNLLSSINPAVDPENKIAGLRDNIAKFQSLHDEYQSQMRDNFTKMTQYLTKYKSSKQEHSKKYYIKKIDKYRSACELLFDRANNTI